MDHDVQKVSPVKDAPGQLGTPFVEITTLLLAARRNSCVASGGKNCHRFATVLVRYHRHGHRNVPVIISVLKKKKNCVPSGKLT